MCAACCAVLWHRYEDAIVSLKAKVKEAEGEDMREAIQDKVRCRCRCRSDLPNLCRCRCRSSCRFWGRCRCRVGAGSGSTASDSACLRTEYTERAAGTLLC